MDDVAKLEAELAAVKAERLARASAREEASRARRLAAEIAKQKRQAEDDEKYADFADEYGPDFIQRLNTPEGMVVVKAPDPLVYRRFRDEMARSDHANPKVRVSFADACDRMAQHCVVYPARAEYLKLAEKFASLTSAVVNAAVDLGQVEAAEELGK